MYQEDWLTANKPEIYWTMLATAENVAKRYKISREVQDRYGVDSQLRAAKSRTEGKFKDEIVPISTKMKIVDKNTGVETLKDVTATEDEGIRPDTNYAGVSNIKPAIEGGVIAAGNASQFSDGASAQVVMSDKAAAAKGLKPLGIYRGFAVAGCEPDEMGIGPVFAVPKLLKRAGLKVDDIGLWELNEAFAVQVIYCRDKLGIPNERLNVDGGAIAIGHPVWRDRQSARRPCADRRQASWREIRRRDDVYRWRDGGRWIIRGRLVQLPARPLRTLVGVAAGSLLLLAAAAGSTAFAELAVSANDNKMVLVNGVPTIVANPRPDTVTIIDLSAKPPRVLHELNVAEQRRRAAAVGGDCAG